MNKSIKILAVLLLLSVVGNLYQLTQLLDKDTQNEIDSDFKLALGRVAAILDSPSANKMEYLFAIEHASKAIALSNYSSFKTTIAAQMLTEIRNIYANNGFIKERDELRNLFIKLSSDPTDMATSQRIIDILRSSSVRPDQP